jgi:hypothetical protein
LNLAAVAEWSKASDKVTFDALGPGFESRLADSVPIIKEQITFIIVAWRRASHE